MKEQIKNLKEEISLKLDNVSDLKDLNDLKVEYLGKKGAITELSSHMRELSNEEKKEIGVLLNDLRCYVNNLFDELKNKFEIELLNKKLESEKIDISLPSTKIKRGSKHPMSLTIEAI